MAANEAGCPSVRALERLLAEELRGTERDSLETHVEGCTPCQEQLERLSAPSIRPGAPATGSPAGPEPDEAFLRRLRELSARPADAGGNAPARPDAARFPGGRLGRYEILEKLAAGGMGTVYRARHVELGKVVALKVLPAGDLSEISLARFKNEMRAIGRLDHPHIVAAHDAGDIDGVHYLAMDFVDGVDLAHLVGEHGRLPIADACEAVRQAALGLQHAFEKGLVHRDVKPSNLMLARGGVVQVLDLGLARATEVDPSERLTSKGALLGTADYLAPEQWELPHAADIRADIYGLGCTLYHLLAGRPPFAGERYRSVLTRMRAHQDEPPPPIAAARPDTPAGLAAVVNRMLAKSPADRYPTPADVAEALRPFAAGADLARLLDATRTGSLPQVDAAATPGPAARETAVENYGSRPAVRRHRLVIPAVAAALALGLLAALVFWPRGPSPGPAAPPLNVTDLRVTYSRNGADHGDLRRSPDLARVKDRVQVVAGLGAPAHYYLIAFNPDGSEQLCQPDDDADRAAPGVPPASRTDVQYPRGNHEFELDAPGLQAFVLVVSAKPLPPYAQWRAGADPIPWNGVTESGDSCWHFDGREFTRFRPRERGKIVPKDSAPQALLELCEYFKRRGEFDAVRICAFPVAGNPD